MQSILDQVVRSTKRTDYPSPDAGYHSFIMGGDWPGTDFAKMTIATSNKMTCFGEARRCAQSKLPDATREILAVMSICGSVAQSLRGKYMHV